MTFITSGSFQSTYVDVEPECTTDGICLPSTLLCHLLMLPFTGVAEHEAGIVPSAVGCALRAELVAPMEQWLWTYQVAQVSLGSRGLGFGLG